MTFQPKTMDSLGDFHSKLLSIQSDIELSKSERNDSQLERLHTRLKDELPEICQHLIHLIDAITELADVVEKNERATSKTFSSNTLDAGETYWNYWNEAHK